MERYLLRLILGIAVMSICLPVFSQVKLSDSGVTKFYDNGTRITYFEMADFPNSAEMREFVKKLVLENPDINRVVIYTNGKTFMYEAQQKIEPDMVVDAVNEALEEFKAQVGDFPPNDPPSTEKPKSTVKVTPHKASSDVKSQTAGVEVQKFEVTEERPTSGIGANEHSVRQARKAVAVDGKGVGAKSIEMASPANSNINSKNR
ncbi:MAG: hypothetical protein IKP45_12155 [Bacteroidales bacterium]|nr:hypothetical protein [Bacteroidales bacterium]